MTLRTLPLVLALLVVPVGASAHPLDVGYLRIGSSKTAVTITLDLDAKAAAILLGREEVDAALVRSQAAALAAATFAAAPITTASGSCSWGAFSADLRGSTVTISSSATCPAHGTRSWTFPFVKQHRVSPRFELMVREALQTSERLTLVDTTTTSLVLATSDASPGSVAISSFIWSGVEHIGAAPSQWRTSDGGWKLPDGIDHILFLLGLLLGGGTLLKLIGVATGFTVGHTITLALAALGVVHPPGWLIEPLIALSIAFVAVEALTQRLAKHRWKIALGFGLIHGFGFANALTALDLSTGAMVKALFGYNVGVELGQLVIVTLLAPAVLAAHRRRWGLVYVVRPAAIAIAICGLFWFVQRISG